MPRLSQMPLQLTVCLAAASLAIGGCTSAPHPMTGREAPAFALTNLDGEDVSLASHAGDEVVVLDFWATWCGPCRMSMPKVDEAKQALEGEPVVFYAVNVQEPQAAVEAFLDETGLDLDVLLDSGGTAAVDYLVQGIPVMMVIDRDGIIREVVEGYSPSLDDELVAAVRNAMQPVEAEPAEA